MSHKLAYVISVDRSTLNLNFLNSRLNQHLLLKWDLDRFIPITNYRLLMLIILSQNDKNAINDKRNANIIMNLIRPLALRQLHAIDDFFTNLLHTK